jgi:hypothetical protein
MSPAVINYGMVKVNLMQEIEEAIVYTNFFLNIKTVSTTLKIKQHKTTLKSIAV